MPESVLELDAMELDEAGPDAVAPDAVGPDGPAGPDLPTDEPRPVALPARDSTPVSRIAAGLHELERLAQMMAVADDYEPADRVFSIPQGFKVSIVIPVYNEAATIQRVLTEVLALPIPKEVVIVDDASTDCTREILRHYEVADGIQIIYKPKNEGKGAALRTGLRRVTGEIVVIQDADLEYDPRDILTLIHPLLAGQADVVYGSRFLTSHPPESSRLHRFGNALLTRLSNLTTGLDLTDMETCYKAFRRDVIGSFEIKQPRFGFEPEVTARLARRGYRLYEVPVRYRPRSYSEGKKIGLKDLFSTLWCILRYALAD